jgi:hypothetical protein
VKTSQPFLDSAEFDAFFLQGDDPNRVSDSLQPVVDAPGPREPSEADFIIRTPAQVARRARYVRLVSRSMAVLSIGLVGLFAIKFRPNFGTVSWKVGGALNPIAQSQANSPPIRADLETAGKAPDAESQVFSPAAARVALSGNTGPARVVPPAAIPDTAMAVSNATANTLSAANVPTALPAATPATTAVNASAKVPAATPATTAVNASAKVPAATPATTAVAALTPGQALVASSAAHLQARANTFKAYPVTAVDANAASTKAIAVKTLSRSAVQPKARSPHAQAAVFPSAPPATAPKPEGYRPPTASFSD